jgi:hypothetical protein
VVLGAYAHAIHVVPLVLMFKRRSVAAMPFKSAPEYENRIEPLKEGVILEKAK